MSRSELPTYGTPGAVPLDTEEARSFYQDRLVFFAKVALLLSLGFLLAGNILALALDEHIPIQRLLQSRGNHWHFAATMVLLVAWLTISRTELSIQALRFVDGGLSLGVIILYSIMGYVSRYPGTRAELVVLMICMLFQLVRAVTVPSSPRQTAVIGALISIPPIALGWSLGSDVPQLLGASPQLMVAAYSALWCVTTVVAATFASRVVHGLEREIREALQLGQYRLEEKLGEGGMGVVYMAHHALLRRPTAVKLLPPEKAGAKNVSRFEREVTLTSRLTHPNTVAIYDYGRTPDGIFYYAMEYLEGIDLERLVEQHGPQNPSRVLHVLAQVCGALAEAHEVGLVHRDIKPANIILCDRGGVPDLPKVVDFGLVKEIETAPAHFSQAASGAITILGTPQYLPPEAITAPEQVDARSDLYALGAVTYFLLTGKAVFDGTTVVEICSHHLHTEPVPPSLRLGRELPEDLDALVLNCLEKDPARRPQSSRALRAALLRIKVPAWTEAQARAWWQEHGRAARARDGEPSEVLRTAAGTIVMDLKRRKPKTKVA